LCEIVLFGGTSEGRRIAERLQKEGLSALVCVASGYGESLLCTQGSLSVHTGKLDADGMKSLLVRHSPRLVIDATHPYATQVSKNIAAACAACGTRRVRVLRESRGEHAENVFSSLDRMIDWLERTEGTVFSTLGAKEAPVLTRITNYQTRVRLRILPDLSGLSSVLSLGFPARHIICMQGPFSRELNRAMFRATGARILITKDSGASGGFDEKLAAAHDCGLRVGVLQRPVEHDGVTLEELLKRIEEHSL
jgi:precorrin-6x reductase